MKRSQKVFLFSSVMLGSVLAGTVTVHADAITDDGMKARPVATQIIEKQEKASAEDLALAKEIFSTISQTTPATERVSRSINTEIIEKQDIQTEADRAVAEEIFSTNTPDVPQEETSKTEEVVKVEEEPTPEKALVAEESANKEEAASVTISMNQSIATIHYARPTSEEKTTILHYVWSAKEGSEQTKWLPAGKAETSVDLNELGGYGVYNINSYKEVDGNLMLFNKSSITYSPQTPTKPEETKPHVEVAAKVNDDELTIQLKRDQALGKALVQYAIWSEENGQDDLQWYPASEITKIDLSKHKGFGKYQLHTYAWLDGKAVGLATTEFFYPKKETPKTPKDKEDVHKADETPTLPARGTYHFTSRVPIKNEAKLASPAITYFDKGMSVYYDQVLENEGHKWLGYVSYTGQRHYVDLGEVVKEVDSLHPVDKPDTKVEDKKDLPYSGTYTFTGRASIKNEAKVSSPEIAYYDKGMLVYYDQVLENEGHRWLGYISYAGQRHFVDLGEVVKKDDNLHPVDKPDTKVEDKKDLPSSGTYTFTERSGIKSEPKVSSPEVAYYDRGMTVNYDKTLTADGKKWISYISYSGNRYYIAVGSAEQEQVPTPNVPKNDEPTNLVAARIAFSQHGSTSNFDVEVTDLTGKGTVHFVVWRENDQVRWYDMKRVGNKFVGSFDINQHLGKGTLYIDAYYQATPGAKLQFVRGVQF